MKVQIVKCSNETLWYFTKKSLFPIKTEVVEASEERGSSAYTTFFSFNAVKDFYYSKELMGFIAKNDCINDEEYSDTLEESKQSFNYEFKARPWDDKFKPLDNFKKLKYGDHTVHFIPCPVSDETVKHDDGKPDFTLIPQEALLEVAKAFTHGATKYGKDNYSLGTNYRRYVAAAQRHINQWLRGEDIDESGTNHLSNAISSLMMVLDNQLTNKGTDDRNKVYKGKV